VYIQMSPQEGSFLEMFKKCIKKMIALNRGSDTSVIPESYQVIPGGLRKCTSVHR
jgi:hypothetical protein